MDNYEIRPDMDLTTFYKMISKKGKEAIAEKKANGEIMHKAPLGYKNARDTHNRSIVIPDPERYELVLLAKLLVHNGLSIRETLQIVTVLGLRSKSGKVLTPMSLWRLTQNTLTDPFIDFLQIKNIPKNSSQTNE